METRTQVKAICHGKSSKSALYNMDHIVEDQSIQAQKARERFHQPSGLEMMMRKSNERKSNG